MGWRDRALAVLHVQRTAVRDAARRKVRRIGGYAIRRYGLLPGGEPDGLGDDDALGGRSLPFTVMVFFGDTVQNLYQLRQWYEPLRQLDRRHRVGFVCLDSHVAAALRVETDLPVVCCGRIGVLEELVSNSDVALALYVNHNVRNLSVIRFIRMLHVYLGHGESDKIASASNQVKAYDFVLVAGEAGRDRLRRTLMRYDTDRHVRLIGRPQLDVGDAPPLAVAHRAPGARPRVVYAPTWEGAQPSMAYSSVVSHGEAILRALLESGRFSVTYRPHPRTGANCADFAQANHRLSALVQSYRDNVPEAQHAVDLSPVWDPRQADSDLLITDISAVATDWMTTGRPLIVTVPDSADAVVDTRTVLDAVPNLTAHDAPHVADLAASVLSGGGEAIRRAWVQYAMGELSPGRSMARFVAQCDELVTLRADELAALAKGQVGDAR